MIYHGVNFLRLAVKLDGPATLFHATGAGLFPFVWPLRGIFIRVLLKYFALLRRLPGAMYQSRFFTGQTIARMECTICLALDGAALLGVGWRGALSSLTFTAMTVTLGIYPNECLRRCPPFVYLF